MSADSLWYCPIERGYASNAEARFTDVVFGVGKKFDELFHGAFVFLGPAPLPPEYDRGTLAGFEELEKASYPGWCAIDHIAGSMTVAFPKTRDDLATVSALGPRCVLPLGLANAALAAFYAPSHWYVVRAGLGEREFVHLIHPAVVALTDAVRDEPLIRTSIAAIDDLVVQRIRPLP